MANSWRCSQKEKISEEALPTFVTELSRTPEGCCTARHPCCWIYAKPSDMSYTVRPSQSAATSCWEHSRCKWKYWKFPSDLRETRWNGIIHGFKVAYTTNFDCFANFLEIIKDQKKSRDVRTTEQRHNSEEVNCARHEWTRI